LALQICDYQQFRQRMVELRASEKGVHGDLSMGCEKALHKVSCAGLVSAPHAANGRAFGPAFLATESSLEAHLFRASRFSSS
jgi:hypothetical protein